MGDKKQSILWNNLWFLARNFTIIMYYTYALLPLNTSLIYANSWPATITIYIWYIPLPFYTEISARFVFKGWFTCRNFNINLIIWMHTCQQGQHSCCNLHAMKLVLPHVCLQPVAQQGQNQNLSHPMVSFKKEPTSQHLTYYAIPIVAETKLLHLQFKNFVHNHSACKIGSSSRNQINITLWWCPNFIVEEKVT